MLLIAKISQIPVVDANVFINQLFDLRFLECACVVGVGMLLISSETAKKRTPKPISRKVLAMVAQATLSSFFSLCNRASS
jgi:hypothetical protein